MGSGFNTFHTFICYVEVQNRKSYIFLNTPTLEVVPLSIMINKTDMNFSQGSNSAKMREMSMFYTLL